MDATKIDFNELCNRVAELLPEGWEIEIKLAKDSGDVTLFDANGNTEEFASNYECIADQVNDALEEAQRLGPCIGE